MATKSFNYTVRGIWPFPLDMLRHDQSSPASDADRVLIERYSAEYAPDRGVFMEPAEINLVGPYKPNTARWESFTWQVPTDTEYAFYKAARQQEREREELRRSALAKLTPDEIAALGINKRRT